MYKSFEELPGMLDMKALRDFLGISSGSVYALMHRADFPTVHVGCRMLVAKENFREWLRKNTNKQ